MPDDRARTRRCLTDGRRRLLVSQVSGLSPPVDLRERRSRLRLLAYLHRLPRPFDRLAGPVHVTASAVVMGRRGILLHRHKRLGTWLQPGGHLEPGELPANAARREGTEESGLLLRHPPGGARLVHVDVHPGPGGHLHLDLRYLLHGPDEEDPRPAAGESQEVRWFALPEAADVADAGLTGLLASLVRPV